MSQNFIRETDLQRKEAELEQVIQEYYRYDMSGLKAEIKNIFEAETGKVDNERLTKLKEIEAKFQTLTKLSQEHIARGTRHKQAQGPDGADAADEKLLENFERYSEQYEEKVKEANTQKQAIRREIGEMEQEVRTMRDVLADKQSENKNLNYLLQSEQELSLEKGAKEEEALRMLNDDLQFQMKSIEQHNDKTGGLVTPLLMETKLREQFDTTVKGYKQFVTMSAVELDQVSKELSVMQVTLEKEQRKTQALEQEKGFNNEELKRIGADYAQLDSELKQMTSAFDIKQRELDELRIQAGDDARKLSVELCSAQQQTNLMVLEVKKYEGLHRFMDLERTLIERAQKDAAGMNPAITALDIDQAEARQQRLEAEIAQISEEWQEKLGKVREQAETTLNQTELKEYQTRIAVLNRELDDKNKEIEQISIERKKVEDTIDKTMEQDIDLKNQTEEIDVLNKRYRKALRDKVSTYDELLNAVKMLAERNSTYMSNEISVAKLTNLTSISKKELEQKEKIHQELKESIDSHDEAAKLAAQSDSQIANKQQKVEELSTELYEKDKMIEQLKTLLGVRVAQEQKMQQELAEGEDGDEDDRIKRQKFAPQQIRSGAAGAQDGQALAPNTKHVFERGSYAPQGVVPRSDFLDSRVVQEMSSLSMPFPLVKIKDDAQEEGAWYVFGSKLILIKEYDEDLLMLREYKSHSDEHFNDYMAVQVESQYEHMQSLLRTSKQHLLKKADPMQALTEEFIKMYKDVLNSGDEEQ